MHELLVDEFKPLAVTVVFGLAMRRERVLKSVDHRNEPFDYASRSALGVLKALLFDTLAVVFKVRLSPKQSLAQFFEVCSQLGHLGVGFRRIGGDSLGFRGLFVRVLVYI